MATATEIATKALKRIRVTGAGETPSAADVADATDALDEMIAGWAAEGLTGDTLPLQDRHQEGVVALLAVRLAEDYGKQVGPILARAAEDGWTRLQAEFIQPGKVTFDWALIRTPSRFALPSVPFAGVRPWTPDTVFALGYQVANEGNIYVCIVAGTSGTGAGPSGTGMNQADGSCVWDYVQSIGSTTTTAFDSAAYWGAVDW